MICSIIPVYNNEKYLLRCINSVLRQNSSSFTIILIDDGSYDASSDYCDECSLSDKRIQVIHTKNTGPSNARNHGIDYSFLNYDDFLLFFMDSDDWIHPRCFDTLHKAIEESGLLISSCTLKRVEKYNITTDIHSSYSIESSEDVYTDFGRHALAYPVGRLYKNEIFESLRFPVGKFFEDVYLLHLVLLQVDKIAYIKEPLYYYYVNTNGTTRKPWSVQRMDGCWAYEEQLEYLRQHAEFSKTYKVIQRDYMQEISYSYYKLQQSDYEYKEYYSYILSEKMKAALKKYAKSAGITIKEHTNYYEIAGLLRVNLYWKYLALKRKLLKR